MSASCIWTEGVHRVRRRADAVKNSRATSVRIPARSVAGTGQSPGRPADSLKADIRLATSTRNALTSFLLTLYGATDPQVGFAGPLACQRVLPGAEEALQVIGRDDATGVQSVDPGHARADPGAGGTRPSRGSSWQPET